MADIKKIIKRYKRARDEKSQWHGHYDDLARVQLPRRLGFTQTTVEGERRTEDIYDGTPMQGARSLANAVGAFLRPQGMPDTSMKATDDEVDNSEEAQVWFADSKQRMINAFNNPKARMRQAAGEVDQDLVVFGTAVMFEGESRKNNSLLFQSLHLKDAVPFFDEEGHSQGMFRKQKLPIRLVAERFGESKLSERARERLKRNEDEKIEILHSVLEREDGDPNALFSIRLPFTNLWIELDQEKELSDGGFHEFPFIVPRWDTTSGEDLGRSPGMIALPDSDTLQAMGETILIAGQRQADPPLAAPNDGSFDAINTFPGGLSYYDVDTAVALGGNPFFPITSGANLAISRDMQLDTRQQVLAAFFRNVLNLPVDGPEMTATEVIARKEEFMREIGPIFGRLESDYSAPMIERAFMIMLRAGQFAPIPQILQGRNIVFEYDSPTKRIKRQIEAAAARLWVEEQIEIAQVKPDALDLINEDEIGRFSAEAKGLPKRLVNSPDVVSQIREARQAQIQAEAQALAIKEGVGVVKTGSEAAKNVAAAGGG